MSDEKENLKLKALRACSRGVRRRRLASETLLQCMSSLCCSYKDGIELFLTRRST